jgi:hypothetical protein
MRSPIYLALLAGAALLPASALAQMPLVIEEPAVIVEEPLVVQEPAVIVQEPMMSGPLGEGDARAIAMMNGMVEIEDVDTRIWDGNFEVEGTDASGDDVEMTIDGDTGEVLEIDD